MRWQGKKIFECTVIFLIVEICYSAKRSMTYSVNKGIETAAVKNQYNRTAEVQKLKL